jgi:hypothetical protein
MTSPTTTAAPKKESSVPKDNDGSSSGGAMSYSERSRLYRRDVFNYDDWVRHRSSKRFIGRFKSLTESGVSWAALADQVLWLAAVATFVCAFNALLVVGYDDLHNVHHDPLFIHLLGQLPLLSLPYMFFMLTSPALSLLLGKSRCQNCLSFETPHPNHTRLSFLSL